MIEHFLDGRPEAFLEASDKGFYRFLNELGYQIEWYQERSWGKLSRIDYSQAAYCGDGRREKTGLFKKGNSKSLKMFGGVLMPATFRAMKRSSNIITLEDIHQVKLQAQRLGMNLGAHDIYTNSWESVHCGMAHLLATGALGFQFDNKFTPLDVVNIIGKKNHVTLESEPHNEVGWLVNYKYGYTREPDGKLFATDREALARLINNPEEGLIMSARAVNTLKSDFKTVYIAA